MLPANSENRPAHGAIAAVRYPTRLLTLALVLTCATFAWLGWILFDSNRDAQIDRLQSVRMEELQGVVLHLGEVQGASVRLAAATGDARWEERFRRFQPQLDAVFSEVNAFSANATGAQAMAQTDAAHVNLTEMENRAFALVRAGRLDAARAVVFSPEYEKEEEIYAAGSDAFIAKLRREMDDRASRQYRFNLLSMVGATGVLAIAIAAWWSVLRGLLRWRTDLERAIDERQQAVGALRLAHDQLEERVALRTSELDRANQTLRESNEKFHQLADNITDAFWIRSPDMCEVHYISPAFEQIWGRSVESLYASPREWSDFTLPEDRKRVLDAFAALTGDAPNLETEYRIVRPDGEVRWVRVRGFQVPDAVGKLIRHIGIVTDITERKRSEAELATVNQTLVVASRHAGMAEVATGVLHNVGNVLNSVNVSATLVAEQVRHSKAANVAKLSALFEQNKANLTGFLANDPRGRMIPTYLVTLAESLAAEQKTIGFELENLRKNIEHIKEIVAMQQTYARSSGVIETVSVPQLVEDALRMNEGSLARHDVIATRDYQARGVLTTDKHKVIQILVNLVRNAKYACDESGRKEKRMVVRTMGNDFGISIAVIDNGLGIPSENLTRIFARGFTTRQHGHGFGLHSAALAARELGGTLTAHSDGPGQGAIFTLQLPYIPENPAS